MSARCPRNTLGLLGILVAACLGSGGCQLTDDLPVRASSHYASTARANNPYGGTALASGNNAGCTQCQQASAGFKPGTGYLPPPVQQTAFGPEGEQDNREGKQDAKPEDLAQAPNPVATIIPPLVNPGPIPVELAQTSLPPYTLAPPDILYIDTLRLVPRPPYRIEALEQLQIIVSETLPNQPINGIFTVGPDGTINLGFSYGTVRIAGLTLDQAQAEIRRHLGNILRNPQVSITLVSIRGLQQTRGEHLVRPDGTINLGVYGTVYVAGLTLGQAKCVIEAHLSKYFLEPQISIDVASYNSKVYYVVLDGGGFGQNVIRLPITGNETVLDAIANVQGLPPVASKRRIWVARPAPPGYSCYQILPVDWRAITEGGATDTNYQLFPGDRVVVRADKLIEFDNWLSKVLAPVERLLGITLLGSSTVQSFRNNNNNGVGFVAFP